MVSVVHCIDAEGPVEETPDVRATLESKPTFATWAEVENACYRANMGRHYYPDTQGGEPVFSWFIADNVGWVDNPRRKATGFHAVYDRIIKYVRGGDSVGWHHHALSPRRRALEYATTWTTNLPLAEEVLCRRLLERGMFPSTFRAGGAIMRADLGAWLDLFIPFDYSPHPPVGGPGEPMDWRRPQPVSARMQVQTAELDSITYAMAEADVERAFDVDAVLPGSGIVSYAGHDRRSIVGDLQAAHALVTKVAGKRPWRWANAQDAVKAGYEPVGWTLYEEAGVYYMTADQAVYGGQPFLAVQDGDLIYRDNPTREDGFTWAFKKPPGARCVVAGWPAL